MLDKVSSHRSDDPKDISDSKRVKPNQPPRNDQFRKTYKDGRPPLKETEDLASVEEKETPPSLFDLSKNKTKGKSALSKHSSDGTMHSKLFSKQNQDESEVGFFNPEEGLEPDTSTDQSLFATNAKVKKEPSQEMHASAQNQTLEELSRQKSVLLQKAKSKKSTEGSSFENKESGSVSKKDKSKSEALSGINADRNQTESAASAAIQAVNFQTEKSADLQEINSSMTIQDLANQIIDRIQIMRKEDLTSTIITLRHPPILDGSTITLTSSDHAKKEFNISFANLSPDAKSFLDRKLQEQPLTETLERKGIVVHMLTTTTQVENFADLQAGQTSRDQQEQQQRQNQRQRQPFQEEEEMNS